MPPATPEQIDAYEKALYVVFGTPELVIRIGEPNPDLDELLEAEGATIAAYITAANPKGVAGGRVEERGRQRRAGRVAGEGRLPLLRGRGARPAEALEARAQRAGDGDPARAGGERRTGVRAERDRVRDARTRARAGAARGLSGMPLRNGFASHSKASVASSSCVRVESSDKRLAPPRLHVPAR